MISRSPRCHVCVAWRGRTACVQSLVGKKLGEQKARELRAQYPDPAIEVWASMARLRPSISWGELEPMLPRSAPATVAAPIFNDVEIAARKAQRAAVRANDPKERIQGQVWYALRRAIDGGRSDRRIGILPYTARELMAHLEARFEDGMSWENYGYWHIDHIKPCALFDLTRESQIRACWALSNIQPLWWLENIDKRDHYGPLAA